MAICRDCKKEVVDNYTTIRTKRNTEFHICMECMRKYQRKGGSSANNHK